MAKQPTISTIATGFYSTSALNTNFENIRDQFDNTLSLDGSTPNAMTADFDLNSQNLLNGNYVYTQRLYLNGVRVTAPEANITWDGEWTTATSYAVDQLVRNDGTVYICLVAHTSGTFSTDLSSAYWEVFAAKGSAGAGTGDLLAANNLSDVANSDTALSNLGGGTVGVAIFKDATAAAVRTEISAQQQDDILDDLVGLTQATNKIPYFDSATTAATLDFLDEDTMVSDSATAVASQQSTKAYVDNLATSVYHLRDRRTSGTAGDSRTGSTWSKHTLQTEEVSNITGASLASSVVTLPAGTYEADVWVDVEDPSIGMLRLRNTTDSSTVALGRYAGGSGSGDGNVAHLKGYFTLAASKNIELQVYGSGVASAAKSSGEDEVYADVFFRKVL